MLHTLQGSYELLRSAWVTANDDALDGTTSGLTYQLKDKPTDTKEIGPDANGVIIHFAGKAAANKTFTFKLWGYSVSGPAELICTGTCTLGTALEGTASTFYVDTIVITRKWHRKVTVADSKNNRVATLDFDACGCKWIRLELGGLGGANATAANGYIRAY